MLIVIVGEIDTLTMCQFDSPITRVVSEFAVEEFDASASLHILAKVLIISHWISI